MESKKVKNFPIRLTLEQKERIDAFSKIENMTYSQFARNAFDWYMRMMESGRKVEEQQP